MSAPPAEREAIPRTLFAAAVERRPRRDLVAAAAQRIPGAQHDRRLIHCHRHGAHGAREAMIQRYLPLARRLALRYRRTPEPVEDLVQVACLGLVKAVDRWDPDRGLAFSTYAVPIVLGELRRHFRDATWDVRPPRRLQELSLAVGKARDALLATTGHAPTVAELADRLDRSWEEIVDALQALDARTVPSLDSPVQLDEHRSVTLGDLVGGNDDGFEQAEARVTVAELTRNLDVRAREILRLRFEDDLVQSEIAERVGLSQMHVSRIVRGALDKLADHADGVQSCKGASVVTPPHLPVERTDVRTTSGS
jgi:RNA polymerase sigma-B factor